MGTIPPLFSPNNDRLERGIQLNQNALAMRHKMQQDAQFDPLDAQLKQQQITGNQMDLQKQQEEQVKLADLKRVMLGSPGNEDRAAFDWSKRNDLNLHMKLVEHYVKQLYSDPDREHAANAFEKATGERVKLGNGLTIIDLEDGSQVIRDDKTGKVIHANAAKKQSMEEQAFESLTQPGKDAQGIAKPAMSPLLALGEVDKAKARPDQNLSDTELFQKDPKAYEQMQKVKSKYSAAQIRIDNPAAKRDEMTPYQKVRSGSALRQEFNTSPIVKTYDEIRQQMSRAESAIAQAKTSKNKVAIDQALINVLNKMIDPNSVVREGEYARTIANSPLFNRIIGKFDTIRAGGAGFTDEERNAIISLSRDFYKDAEALYTQHFDEYKRIATDSGFDADKTFINRKGVSPKAEGGGGGNTKIINGVTYKKVQGGWQKAQ